MTVTSRAFAFNSATKSANPVLAGEKDGKVMDNATVVRKGNATAKNPEVQRVDPATKYEQRLLNIIQLAVTIEDEEERKEKLAELRRDFRKAARTSSSTLRKYASGKAEDPFAKMYDVPSSYLTGMSGTVVEEWLKRMKFRGNDQGLPKLAYRKPILEQNAHKDVLQSIDAAFPEVGQGIYAMRVFNTSNNQVEWAIQLIDGHLKQNSYVNPVTGKQTITKQTELRTDIRLGAEHRRLTLIRKALESGQRISKGDDAFLRRVHEGIEDEYLQLRDDYGAQFPALPSSEEDEAQMAS